ncbi:hypothetical protein COB64_04185 [Candidatus Wolfebacteria bacterium]|nr:MAG: hypothetical protein COB64_04185 [Candidatus Wolfebacteria bacterium]
MKKRTRTHTNGFVPFVLVLSLGVLSFITSQQVNNIQEQKNIYDEVEEEIFEASSSEILSSETTKVVLTEDEFIEDETFSMDITSSLEDTSGNLLDSTFSLKFIRTLGIGNVGLDVKELQKYLNRNGFLLSPIGYGSPDNETIYFGPRTKEALRKFQEAHSDKILDPFELVEGTGFLGKFTIEFISSYDTSIQKEAEALAQVTEKPILIDNAATHSCSVTPYVQKLIKSQSKARVLKLEPVNESLSFNIETGELPDGLSVSFIETEGVGSRDIDVTLSTTDDASEGSFNIIVIYRVVEDNGNTVSIICQLNVVVE